MVDTKMLLPILKLQVFIVIYLVCLWCSQKVLVVITVGKRSGLVGVSAVITFLRRAS